MGRLWAVMEDLVPFKDAPDRLGTILGTSGSTQAVLMGASRIVLGTSWGCLDGPRPLLVSCLDQQGLDHRQLQRRFHRYKQIVELCLRVLSY